MINTVALQGRLTYQPELRSTTTGKSVIRFQIACDRNYQKGNERQADFIDCVAWDKTADFIHRYFFKGSEIAIDGRLQTTNFTDKNGNSRKSTEVVVNNVSFCGPKPDDSKPNLNVSVEDSQYEEEIIDDDEKLPWE